MAEDQLSGRVRLCGAYRMVCSSGNLCALVLLTIQEEVGAASIQASLRNAWMEERSPGRNYISVHCQHSNISSVDGMGRPTNQPLLFLSRVYFHLPLDTGS